MFRTLSTASNTYFTSFTIEAQNILNIDFLDFDNSIKIFPNPASDIMTISSSFHFESLELYDLDEEKFTLKSVLTP